MPARQPPSLPVAARIREQLAMLGEQFVRGFQQISTGGDWARAQPPAVRRNLSLFWLDGFFASAADNVVVTYLVVYILALGASQAQVGLLSALSSLSAALLLLPGAMLSERTGRRREIVLVGGGWARIALLLLALSPLFIEGPPLVTLAIVLAVSRDALGNLAFPAWMSITADVVPMEGRGRFFASRNMFMAVSGIAATFVVGLLITRSSGVTGYQVALGMACLVGSLSVVAFSRLSGTQRSAIPAARARLAERWKSLPAALDVRGLFREQGEFARFAAVSALWNFSINIAGPFFTVYLVKNLEANATLVSLTSIASSLAGMLAQRKLGELNDRWGARKLTVISGLLIPAMPLLWLLTDSAWQVIPINLLGGALWGAYGMGSFNHLLEVTPGDRRERFSALFQIIVTVSLAAGAALGSVVIGHWGYPGVFIASSAGRFVAALLFARAARRTSAAESGATAP